MRVIIELTVRTEVDEEIIRPISDALESQTFAESCCIGSICGTSVVLRCPKSKFGIIADLAKLNGDGIGRLIQLLAASVEPQPEQSET